MKLQKIVENLLANTIKKIENQVYVYPPAFKIFSPALWKTKAREYNQQSVND